jgi:hypothetical protein
MPPYSFENFKDTHFKELISLLGFGWLRVYIRMTRGMQCFSGPQHDRCGMTECTIGTLERE